MTKIDDLFGSLDDQAKQKQQADDKAASSAEANQNTDKIVAAVTENTRLATNGLKSMKGDVTVVNSDLAKSQDVNQAVEAINKLNLTTFMQNEGLPQLASNLSDLSAKTQILQDKFENEGLKKMSDELGLVVKKLDQVSKVLSRTEVSVDSKLQKTIDSLSKSINAIDFKPSVNVSAAPTKVITTPIDFKPILEALSNVESAIKDSAIPGVEIDMSMVTTGLSNVQQAIQALRFPVPNYVLPFRNQAGKAAQVQLSATGGIPVVNPDGTTITGGGAGGGPATIADGADAAEGATTDAAVTAGSTGTVSGKLRQISSDVSSVKTSLTNASQKTQLVDGSGNVIASTSNALNVATTMAPADSSPSYSNLSLGGIPLRTDAAGNLQTWSSIVTDEGTSRAWFTGTSLSFSPGTATFTNGSATVTGSGFSAADIHFLDFVKISAHGESAWAQVSYVTSDTTLTLIATYTGATTTGAYDVARAATVTGSGATISVATGQLTIASGTTNSAASVVYKTAAFPPFQNGSCDSAFSISQRIANQDIYYGFESATSAPRFFARFHFSGVTNTQVITESGYNPTTTPSANETETNTITLPNGVTTAASNTYRIEAQYDRVIFYINNVIVATHTQRILPIWVQTVNSQFRVVNGTGASSTSVIANYMFQRAYARIDTNNQSPITTNSINTVNALPAGTTLGSPAMAIGDKFGRQIILNNAIRDTMASQTTTISASTSETTIITAAASTFKDLSALMISNTSATAARVDIRDTTAGSVIFQVYVPAGDVRGITLTSPWPQTSVNSNWTAQSSASVTDLRISCQFINNK